MFSGILQAASAGAGAAQGPPGASPSEPSQPHEIPPPTPVRFPSLLPRAPGTATPPPHDIPLRTYIRSIQRPADIKLSHFEALGLHIIPDAPLTSLLPDPSFLPPSSWSTPLPDPSDTDPDDLDDLPPTPPLPLNNGRPAPGRSTYTERMKELSTPNPAAFRTVRRLPSTPSHPTARLGNAYEFFKNLELISGFWVDTSLSGPEPLATDDAPEPVHQRIHIRSGTGSQTPPDFRAALLAAFVKLVAYDFSCNVSLPRVEPRLHIGPSLSPPPNSSFPNSSPPSSFPTNISFIYRTPSDRLSARGGIVEGPLAALSARHATSFDKPLDELLDLARETAALFVAAQQRNREGREERKYDPADPEKWWCFKPRWGGGPGGPIGKEEGMAVAPTLAAAAAAAPSASSSDLPDTSSSPTPTTAAPRPPPKRRTTRKTTSLYDAYRQLRPPSTTWDRKARYQCIGREPGAEWDDVFLVSCLNHHVAISRLRVGRGVLVGLEGLDGEGEGPGCAGAGGGGVNGHGNGGEEGEVGVTVWRSRWWDLFKAEERVEAMGALWGMMGWLMRDVEGERGERMEGVEGGA
ncbi:hypothetical protein VE01_08664 [Pseudogymnoascus verrucosus]|uniref:Uncharacterized protein n=1 Tax=Pseudogymnoascus verrucosus TaxID=342668 RepID=A0A1B8GCE0_9PEZI|nr:uncharacterized protein VE01_08664 [Pseudogymnoascus verrucosus]OBT93508.1 hypothetical protein VE01_08664 [Pseudogymnoascus verrucosus]